LRLRQSPFGTRVLTAAVTAVAALAFAGTAAAERYLVLYKDDVPKGASGAVERAGGTFLFAYDPIGIAIVESANPAFESKLQRDNRVFDVVRTDGGGAASADEAEAEGPPRGQLPNEPAAGQDTFEPLQWNMRMIHAREAQAITGGSPLVTVGLIDTGVDPGHPDLLANLDPSRSVSCVGGVPNQTPGAWADDNGHGTHNAGTIMADSNGIGIVGVAPNVKLAAIKAGTADNRFDAPAVVCALVWAAEHGIDVANNSYTIDHPDPSNTFDFFCHSDREDRAVIKAVRRATRYALRNGVSMVASAGNSNLDLSQPPLGNECIRLPSELSGVMAVSAVGPSGEKASYSNYGVGVIDLAAPGGDGPPPGGPVLSTWPSYLPPPPGRPPHEVDPLGGPGATYRFMSGTSVAAAHVSGVAALVVSWFGDLRNPRNGKLPPGRVEAIVERTATPKACPPEPTTCQGGRTNGWYGHGLVDALRAVTHDPGN
jgi:subtilisin family serine protease